MAWWGLPFKSQNAEACIHVDTGFLLLTLRIRPFPETSDNENKAESKGILRGLLTLPISKRSELNGNRLFWTKMSIMQQQKAYRTVQASLIKRR